MSDYKPCSTPVDTQAKLSEDDTLGRRRDVLPEPDIAYVVQQVCLHMHTPREPHLTALKRIMRYLWGSLDYRLL
jgi:hypothetical protein